MWTLLAARPESCIRDKIVAKLFEDSPLEDGDRVLYPGLGTGPFVAAVERYCNTHDYPVPTSVGIESDPEHVAEARDRHGDRDVDILERDFIEDVGDLGEFEYIVGTHRMSRLRD